MQPEIAGYSNRQSCNRKQRRSNKFLEELNSRGPRSIRDYNNRATTNGRHNIRGVQRLLHGKTLYSVQKLKGA